MNEFENFLKCKRIRSKIRKSIILIFLISIALSASGNLRSNNIENDIMPPILKFDIEISREDPFRGSININDTEYSFDLRDSEAYNAFKECIRLYGKFIPGGINR